MMGHQDMLKIKTCILKVNIHCRCDGCEQKVKKLLQKIDGVYSVSVDADQGKVVVTGDVDPEKLIKKLKRSGKHAEIWGGQKQKGVTTTYPSQNYPIHIKQQFQNMQLDSTNNNPPPPPLPQYEKGHKGGGGGGGVGGQVGANFQNFKAAPLPTKQQKSIKFKLPEEEIDGFDESPDEDDNFDDDFDYEDKDEDNFDEQQVYATGPGQGNHHSMPNKMMPVMVRGPNGPGGGMMNGPNGPVNNNKGYAVVGGGNNYGNGKKGDVIEIPIQTKGKGGNFNEAKNGNDGGKKSNRGDQGVIKIKNNKEEKEEKHKGGDDVGDFYYMKKSTKKSNGGGMLGRFLGLRKNGKGGGEGNINKNKNGEKVKSKEGKFDGQSNNNSKDLDDDFVLLDFDIPSNDKNGKSGEGRNVNGNGKGKVNVGHQMGPMNQKGPNPMTQMRNIPAMNGGGGYYQGMQMQPTPYNNLHLQQQQQQQNMAMMMNQQQQQHMAMMMKQQQQQQQAANMNMYPPAMMYGGPHPSMNYMPPPPMPSHPMADPITHVFSDENTEGYCTIM